MDAYAGRLVRIMTGVEDKRGVIEHDIKSMRGKGCQLSQS